MNDNTLTNTHIADPVPPESLPVDTHEWEGFTFKVFDSIVPISDNWDGFVEGRDLFMATDYLAALECAPPHNLRFYYVLVYRGEKLEGLVYTQLGRFAASKSINYDRGDVQDEMRTKWSQSLKESLARRIDFYTLLCGNTMLTGEHGYLFTKNITHHEQMRMVDSVLNWLVKYLKSVGMQPSLYFIKDFVSSTFSNLKKPHTTRYYEFSAQPNMIFDLNPNWKSSDDYTAAMQSKYRTRVKRARKKSTGIEKRELSAEEIENLKGALTKQYLRIADRASFNLFEICEDYWPEIKRRLGDRFKLIAYFFEGELVAFYSLIFNDAELEAHFLGYEDALNREKQIYMNMLLDIVEHGIRNKMKRIVYGRTALEIKSSVGAEPEQMYFYLRHRIGWLNCFTPWFYGKLYPSIEWVQRRPFKKQRNKLPLP